MSDITEVPPLAPDAGIDEMRKALAQLIENDRVRERDTAGERAAKFMTWGDAEAVGLVIRIGGGLVGTGGGVYTPPDTGIVDDSSPPEPISGLSVSAAISHFIVEFDAPTYGNGGGNGYTEIYMANYSGSGPLPIFADAVLSYAVTGRGNVAAIPAQPGQTTHFWVGAVTANGVRQVDTVGPTGGTNGVSATTGQDVSALLGALTGQITESELYSGLAGRIDLIDGTGPGSVNARVATEASARTSADTALAASISTVSAQVGVNTAAIATEASARASADTALASSISTVSAQVGVNSAAIATEATARATADGALFAQYTVKVDLAGHVSGYGLASTNVDGTPKSAFGVRADQFWVAPPSVAQATAPVTNLYNGFVWLDTSTTTPTTRYWDATATAWTTTAPALPFVIQTTPTTINGVAVPPGVYIADAYIKNGTITSVKIGDAQIDDAKIVTLTASKITAGSIAVGEDITSTGFVSGSAGWRIRGNGAAEFSNVVARGSIYASAGAIGGAVIAASYVQSSNYNGTSLGWKLDNTTGKIYAFGVEISGDVNITGGSINLASAGSGARTHYETDRIRVFDASGTLRVKIGNLA